MKTFRKVKAHEMSVGCKMKHDGHLYRINDLKESFANKIVVHMVEEDKQQLAIKVLDRNQQVSII